MKEIVEKIKKGPSTKEACEIVELYIYKLKGVKVKIKNPEEYPTNAQFLRQVHLLYKAYETASEFLLNLYYYPEDCTVKTY